jgi:hypothetical protein
VRARKTTKPEPEAAVVDRPRDAAGADFDLDALMVKVRAAANAGDTIAGSLATDVPQAANDERLDLMQVIAAQVEWNTHTTKTLAAVADCLRHIQSELGAEQDRLPRHAVVAEPAAGNGTQRRQPRRLRRKQPGQAEHHSAKRRGRRK